MKNQPIQMILQNALEEEIPSSQIQLWSAVESNLTKGKTRFNRHGIKTFKLLPAHSFSFAILTIIVFLGVLIATPQGRVLAQNILQFFVNPAAPTMDPPMMISVAEAEAQIGFEIVEFPDVPDGFAFLGARLFGNTVRVEYEAEDGRGYLIIQQVQEGIYQSDWDKIPEDAVIPVKISNLDGEFVKGTFEVSAGEIFATWNPAASMSRLRWLEDGIWYKIIIYGEMEAIDYLDQVNVVDLAEILISKP
jgi:hypothetical protein